MKGLEAKEIKVEKTKAEEVEAEDLKVMEPRLETIDTEVIKEEKVLLIAYW